MSAVTSETSLQLSAEKDLAAHFESYELQVKGWQEKANSIVVTDPSQVREMKLARTARLELKQLRCDIENRRKILKEDSLRRGKAIDGIANRIKEPIERLEAELLEKELFAQRIEEKRIASLVAERSHHLLKLGANPALYHLGEMSEAEYATVLKSAQEATDARVEAEMKAAKERRDAEIKAAEERRRLEEENARLRTETVRRIEAERIEREAREKLERAERERLATEERKRREEIEASKRAESAPDREKLIAFARSIGDLQFPVVGPQFDRLRRTVAFNLNAAVAAIKSEAL